MDQKVSPYSLVYRRHVLTPGGKVGAGQDWRRGVGKEDAPSFSPSALPLGLRPALP